MATKATIFLVPKFYLEIHTSLTVVTDMHTPK